MKKTKAVPLRRMKVRYTDTALGELENIFSYLFERNPAVALGRVSVTRVMAHDAGNHGASRAD